MRPLKAIKEFCLDCCGGSHKEVKLCVSPKCSLFPYRLGHNPKRGIVDHQEMTEVSNLAQK